MGDPGTLNGREDVAAAYRVKIDLFSNSLAQIRGRYGPFLAGNAQLPGSVRRFRPSVN